jgi:hypothetical protein
VWLAPRLGRFTPGKDPVPIVVQEAGWAPGPVCTCAKNLAATGIRSPDLPARSHSLDRRSYPGVFYIQGLLFKFNREKTQLGVDFQSYVMHAVVLLRVLKLCDRHTNNLLHGAESCFIIRLSTSWSINFPRYLNSQFLCPSRSNLHLALT